MLLPHSVHMEESSYAIYLEFPGTSTPDILGSLVYHIPIPSPTHMQGLNSFMGIFNLALPLLLPFVSHHSLRSAHTKVFQRLTPHTFSPAPPSRLQLKFHPKNPAYGTTLSPKLTYFFAPSSLMVQCTKSHSLRPIAQPYPT